MYKRLVILTVIIASALCGLTLLGYHAINKWGEGLEGKRLGEFAEVAEQIRLDIKRKLDAFIETEENRPYTHYQYWYVPDNVVPGQQQISLLRSPLAGQIVNSLAIASFQIDPDGNVRTVNDSIVRWEGENEANKKLSAQVEWHRRNVEYNLIPVLNLAKPEPTKKAEKMDAPEVGAPLASATSKMVAKAVQADEEEGKAKGKVYSRRQRAAYPIESLRSREQQTQVLNQDRVAYDNTLSYNASSQMGINAQQTEPAHKLEETAEAEETIPGEQTVHAQLLPDGRGTVSAPEDGGTVSLEQAGDAERAFAWSLAGRTKQGQDESLDLYQGDSSSGLIQLDLADTYADVDGEPGPCLEGYYYLRREPDTSGGAYVAALERNGAKDQDQTVQVRISGFRTIVTGGENAEKSIFGGQVFLVREVQIEDRQIKQGFQLNEEKLKEDVRESVETFMREDMSFELSRTEKENVAYAATLDFVFGGLVLNLKEKDPGRILKQISDLRNLYFIIIVIVLIAVTLGLASLWRNARAQIKLAEKKDDFISAVSHELRTPLTSIRMYSEMLEKNWIKSEDKLGEYYRSMRQESERLSRLIENVLDFSRIQKGRKKYSFSVGDLNECIADVVEMMTPYAAQNGFCVQTELEQIQQVAFDSDAIKQIVVNLLDNAIKYAGSAQDKTITVRTRSDTEFVLIEVEDHGPGVPHRQRRKIFEEFYRLGSEATRETTGTGLGLAIVKKFAQAHDGFVEIIAARPTGAIFRVGLTVSA